MTPSENELQAYVDGRLEPARRDAISAYLAERPEEAARVQAYREHNAQLRALFNPVLDEPLPERLREFRLRRPVAAYALAAGWLALGIAVGWGANAWLGAERRPSIATLPRQAAVAHAVYSPEVRHPVEVGVEQREHLVGWLSKRLGTTLKPPTLSREGYELVGGRLLPGEGGAVAQFMYQDAKGMRLTLYVSRLARADRNTAFRFSQEDKVAVFYWVDGPFGYALSGELPKADLLAIATSVYKQINP
jgi:anti-sigma factor RsiW